MNDSGRDEIHGKRFGWSLVGLTLFVSAIVGTGVLVGSSDCHAFLDR
jgi:hypothetical protein